MRFSIALCAAALLAHACSEEGGSVDLDGTVTLVGLTGQPGNCDNLDAPWGNPPLPLF